MDLDMIPYELALGEPEDTYAASAPYETGHPVANEK